MKKLKSLCLTLGAMTLLGACSNDDESSLNIKKENVVSFETNIRMYQKPAVRAAGVEWAKGDAIGVYALQAGSSLEDANIFEGKANVEHKTDMAGAKGVFQAVNNAIELDGKKAIDVIAYYPYTKNINNYTLPIDVKDQTNLESIDFLYSNDLKNITKADDAKMQFNHQLAQLVFLVEKGNGFPSLDGLGAKDLNGLKVEGSLNLKDGKVSLKEGEAVTIQPNVNGTTVSAILLPGQNLDKNVSMKFTLNKQEFTWIPKKDITLTSGTKYTFRVQLSKDGSVVVLNPDGTINDWVEGNPEGGVDVITPGGTVDPEPEPGKTMSMADFLEKYKDGNKDNPLKVEDDIILKGVVVSTDEFRNINNKLYVQDKTAAVGLYVYSQNGTASDYQRGQEIEIQVKGLAVTDYFGVKQIAAFNDKGSTMGIDFEYFKKIAKVVTKDPVELTPIVLSSIDEFDVSLINHLIKIENVKFKEPGTTFVVDDKQTNSVLSDKTEKNFVISTRKDATFGAEIIPKGSGAIVGILDLYQNNYQILPCSLDDIQFEALQPQPEVNISVDKEELIFDNNSGSGVFNITADADVAWTIEYDQENQTWFTLDSKEGKGGKSIKVNVNANNGVEAQVAKLTLKSGNKEILMWIVQASKKSSDYIYAEEFAKLKDKKNSIKGQVPAFNTDYREWVDNPELKYSADYDSKILRATGTMDGHLWFAANNSNTIRVEGISVPKNTDLVLSFELVANNANKVSANVISIKVNGQPLKALPDEMLAGSKGYKEFSLDIPAVNTDKIKIEFIGDLTSASDGVRLDKIKITKK